MILPKDLICEKILLHKPAAAHRCEVLGYQLDVETKQKMSGLVNNKQTNKKNKKGTWISEELRRIRLRSGSPWPLSLQQSRNNHMQTTEEECPTLG